MKQTLLNSALANMTGALALTIMLGAGVAFADDNNATQGVGNLALQDFLNGSLNDNLSGNTAASHNDNDGADVDVTHSANGNFNGNLSGNTTASGNDNDGADVDLNDVANGSLNGNLSGNTANSHNDNDGADLDIYAHDVANDKSHDDNDLIDADVMLNDAFNDKSITNTDASANWKVDNSVSIEDVAVLASSQQLLGVAAEVNIGVYSGDITTGSIVYGAETNKMFAGNMTTSNNTGAGSVAQAASAIQANGVFSIGN